MSESERNRAGLSGKAIARIVVAALIVVFILQNTDDTRVTFLFFDLTTGLWLALVVAMLLGGAAGFMIRGRADKE